MPPETDNRDLYSAKYSVIAAVSLVAYILDILVSVCASRYRMMHEQSLTLQGCFDSRLGHSLLSVLTENMTSRDPQALF